MICPNCNAPNRDGAKFCVGCGGALVASPPPSSGQGYWRSFVTASGRRDIRRRILRRARLRPAGRLTIRPRAESLAGSAANAASRMSSSARFCTRCGAAMPAASPGYLPGTPAAYPQQAQSGASVQGRKRSRGWIVAGGVVVVLLLLGGIAWLASREWLRMGTNETAQLMPAGPGRLRGHQPERQPVGSLGQFVRSQGAGAAALPARPGRSE